MPGGIAKKAFLQSAPWAVVGFAMLALSLGPASWTQRGRRPTLILFSLVAGGVLAAFAVSGASRDDGFSFNQRYLLELVPLAAVAFAWSVEHLGLRVRTIVAGGAIGTLAFLAVMIVSPDASSLYTALMTVPLVLALGALVAWISSRFLSHGRNVLALMIGICLGWSLAVHLGQDLRGSHRSRNHNLSRMHALAPELTDGTVLVTYWGTKDAAVPLLFDRDFLILDLRADEGKDAALLIRDLLSRGRRVLVLEEEMPAEVLDRAVGTFNAQPLSGKAMGLTELHLKAP
jgi:hypothetical protein